jgi:hypothetical protein
MDRLTSRFAFKPQDAKHSTASLIEPMAQPTAAIIQGGDQRT